MSCVNRDADTGNKKSDSKNKNKLYQMAVHIMLDFIVKFHLLLFQSILQIGQYFINRNSFLQH